MTILAARRVLPPDLMTPAKASKPFMKDTGPDDLPLEWASFSLEERSDERLEPVPEPYLKSMPSVTARVRMDRMSSFTELMKQAEHCGFGFTPTLNQTGLLNAAFWLTRMCVSSISNVSASSSEEKYPPSRPQSAMVLATRSTICFTEVSRSGLPISPRKYLE